MHVSRRSSASFASPTAGSRALPAWKRSIDYLCCIAALPFFLLVGAFLYVLLAFTSPGPLLFTQERVGYKGRRFRLYKFRTMHAGADTRVHHDHVSALLRAEVPMNKMDAAGDRRLVPGGWLIRATGLDELPQVLNVLRGDMSIVGPRPCIAYEWEQYSVRDRARLNAVPGLTGLWQVSGKNRTTFNEMVRLDVKYSLEKSWRMDLGIIARTMPALLTQVRDTRARRNAAPAPRAEPVTTQSAATFQA